MEKRWETKAFNGGGKGLMIKGREMRRMRRKYGWIDVIRLGWIRVEAEGGNKFEGLTGGGRGRRRKDFIEKQNLSCSLEKWNHWWGRNPRRRRFPRFGGKEVKTTPT